jgi:DNA-binding NtrC family response regulator
VIIPLAGDTLNDMAIDAAAAKVRVLLVDDDPSQRSLLESFLQGQGFQTATASLGEEALQVLRREAIQMMVSDVRMPGLSGLETFKQARREFPSLPVLMVTAFPDIREAVEAMRDGAVNYLQKPIDLDEFLASIRRATGLQHKPVSLQLYESKPLPSSVVAESPLMQAVFRDAALVAPTESRILLTGESGAGKEIVADVIHAWSKRTGGPLVKINCAAIPDTLLESELFGHEKGAFTGAQAARTGRFEEASNGTILLDEIGEMSPHLQAKLLRIIQDGKFERIGSNRERHTSARILAATNRELEEEVRSGRFRQDLFFRLNVMEIHIPPLRERPEDIIPLARRFAAEFSQSSVRISPSVIGMLRQYDWPGNVRELRNAMERTALMSRGELIVPEHFPARIRKAVGEGVLENKPASHRLKEIESQAILQALRQHQFNRTETAKALGISRRALLYKLQHLKEAGHQIEED